MNGTIDPGTTLHPARTFAHIPGLDGLRALSVIAVMLYHAHVPWMHGGFLGVEVFFVISGFLITSLLLHEFETRGRIDLGAFWKRRALRLLPALWVVLAGVAIVGAVALGPGAAQFRGDLLASFLYAENWHQILGGGSYFADQGLPLLRHIWSLAVEEQFYMLWPLLVVLIFKAGKGRRWVLGLGTLLLAGASLATMVHLADPHNSSSALAQESLNRAYLGTDTRAFGILLGVLLSLLRWRPGRVASAFLDGFAFLALAGVLALCVLTDIQDPRLYPFGFLLVDLCTLTVLLSLGRTEARLPGRFLSLAPLEWVGKRSYGIYLLHWPLFRLLGKPEAGWQGMALAAGLTVILAEASYRWVEVPIRAGALGRFLASAQVPVWRRRLAALGLGAGLAVAGLATVRLAMLPTYHDEVAESLKAAEAVLDGAPQSPEPVVLPQAAESHEPSAPVVIPAIPPGRLEGLTVTAIGDSVMKGAAVALAQAGREHLGEQGLRINAEESRPFAWAKDVVRRYKSEEKLGEVVVIHLGTNNSHIPPGDFEKLMGQMTDRELVLFVTAKSDKVEICDQVNLSLARMASAYPNAKVFDWKAASQAHPDLFYSDRTHLRPLGAKFYAASILARIGSLVPPSSLRQARKLPTVPVTSPAVEAHPAAE